MSGLPGYPEALEAAKKRAKESHMPAFVVEDAYYGRWIVVWHGGGESPRLTMDTFRVTWSPAQWNGTHLIPESFLVERFPDLRTHY